MLSALAVVILCLGVGQTAAEKRRLPAGHLEQALQARQEADPGFMKEEIQSGQTPTTQPAPALQSASGTQAGPRVTSAAKATQATAQAIPNPAVGFNPAVNYTISNFSISPPIKKFVDTLPGLNSANASTNGSYIPVAIPDQTTYPDADYYELSEIQYTQKLASDLPGSTTLRGYKQTNTTDATVNINQYLGPAIIAHSYDPKKPVAVAGPWKGGNGRPVRLKVTNSLPLEGATPPVASPVSSFFLPVDTTLMGASMGPKGGTEIYAQNRTSLHLHGGFTPWICDGTPHQWWAPSGQATSYPKGASFQDVPDMLTNGTSPCAATGNPAACFARSATDGISTSDGIGTFYYTNQQSARLMFYHDHAYGITRLNVYGGMAAPYLLVDANEEALIATGKLPNQAGVDKTTGATGGGVYRYGIPLVIQDKSFVNDVTTAPAGFTGVLPSTTATLDPLWSTYVPNYTTGGSLWYPHEYMPNENIYDPSGFNTLGRWDYGPFMSPPLLANNTTLPSPTIVPEAYGDTILINGAPYPTVTLPPKPMRFRILNAANERVFNLQLYYAVDKNGVVCKSPNIFDAASCTEVAMVAATPPVTPCAAAVSVGGGGLANAALVSGLPLNGTGLPAGCTPSTWPTDGRNGGVPNPANAGPPIIQIGSEGGFLPAAAVIPSTPINFEYNRRAVTVLDTTSHALMMAPAERADVIVDLASVPPGSVLIVYNDMPAPTPLYDSRNDYYTNDPDQTVIGGAPTTVAGWGPNTRTLMQIHVATGTAGAPINITTLNAGLATAYAATQSKPIVPETAYNAAWPNTYTTDVHVQNPDQTVNLTGKGQSVAQVITTGPGTGYTTAPAVTFIGGGCTTMPAATAGLNGVTAITITTSGTGYTTAPTVTITGGGGTGATAIAQISGGVVSAINMVTLGTGYTTLPTVTLTGGGGTGAAATASVSPNSVGTITLTNAGAGCTSAPYVFITGGNGTAATAAAVLVGDTTLDSIGIAEGFDIQYGRMNATMATAPNLLNPNVVAPVAGAIPGYLDPPSDYWYPGVAKVFRVTHIGADSHGVHFHLGNLQVVNRVDWTNTYMPPDANEIGWKETVRTYPFTDLILASKFSLMHLPFQIPQSNRLLDPTSPPGSSANFPAAPPVAGQVVPAALTNVMTNFGWEYVYHCHYLDHEENDMMRPMVFQVSAPVTPTGLSGNVNASHIALTWGPAAVDPNTDGFTIQRSTSNTFPTGATTVTFTVAGNTARSYTDNTVTVDTRYYYRIMGTNAAGNSAWSNIAVINVVVPPTNFAATTAVTGTTASVSLTWTLPPGTSLSFTIQRSTSSTFTGPVTSTVGGTATSSVQNGLPRATQYYYRILTTNSLGTSNWSPTLPVVTP